MQRPNRRRAAGAAATTLTACSLFAAATLPAAAMTVTFIRHGESYGNATNKIDTSIPGPNLTPQGESEANTVADYLQSAAYTAKYGPVDAIYASTMIRTQQTAQPLANDLNMPVTIIGYPKNDNAGERIGVQEINAGIFEGLPEKDGIGRIGYILAPLAWTLGLQFVSVPGGENGLEFNERMTNALTQIEQDTPAGADDQQNAAVFSHGATIMMWTMMNVDNPNLLLILQHPLSNTDVVVVESNGEGGWTLKSWAGADVAAADYPTQMFVNVRDLIVAPQKAIYNMRVPVLSLDAQGIVTTGAQGVQDVAEAGVKFVKDSITDTINAIAGIPGSLGQSPAQVSKLSTQKIASGTNTVSVNDLAEKATAAVESGNADAKSATEKVTEPAQGKISATRSANGATKLTYGNKAEPGKALSVTRDRAKQTADDVRSGVESSVKQVGEAVKKLTGADKVNNKADNGAAKPKAASKNAA
jgi:broad specificity phosphatase PhoE